MAVEIKSQPSDGHPEFNKALDQAIKATHKTPGSQEPASPGSPEAIKAGCTCPRMDNNNGAGFGNGQFWIAGDCSVHSNPKYKGVAK